MSIQHAKLYWDDWKRATILPNHSTEVGMICRFISRNVDRYNPVASVIQCPFWVVGIIHYRESNFKFNTHLANGDPLFDINGKSLQTVNEPKGLGPYKNWADGAIGALKDKGWGPHYHWDVVNAMENIESYNGLGYLAHGRVSPYLYSFSNLYSSGKYGSDSNYDPTLVDKQAGAVPIMLALKASGIQMNEIQAA